MTKQNPDRYAVFGNPISHSRSPEIHARFAKQTEQNITYERILAPLDGFAESVRDFIGQGGKGANVTVPFKIEAFQLATHHTERARTAKAVNTLRFDDDVIIGDNTDGVGLVNDILRNYGLSMFGKRVLLLGAGGAAQGVLYPFIGECPTEIVIANRTISKAIALANEFTDNPSTKISVSAYADLAGPFDVIVNATSTGLSGDMPPVPSSIFNANALAVDMVYGKNPTRFLQLAAENGAEIRDGLGMLVEQAAESFFLWRGVRPKASIVLDELRTLLQ